MDARLLSFAGALIVLAPRTFMAKAYRAKLRKKLPRSSTCFRAYPGRTSFVSATSSAKPIRSWAEGISMAMQSAWLLARALTARQRELDDLDAAGASHGRVRRPLGPRRYSPMWPCGLTRRGRCCRSFGAFRHS